MKKRIGILCLIFMMFATFSLATETIDLGIPQTENQEDGILPISQMPVDTDDNGYEMIYDDVYKMESQVTINQVIDGNVYVMARDVKVENAVIYGNLFVMAENIQIVDSEIAGSIFAMGENVDFSGMTFSGDTISQVLPPSRLI